MVRGRSVTAYQGRPHLEAEPPEVLADRARVGVSSVELSTFREPVADHVPGSRVGGASPSGENVAPQVVKVSREALELGGEAQHQGFVQGSRAPAASTALTAHKAVCSYELVEPVCPIVVPS